MVALTVSDTDPYSPDARRVWRLVIQEAVQTVLPLPGFTSRPRIPTATASMKDLNANGRLDFADIVLYFNQMTWIRGQRAGECLRSQWERQDRFRRYRGAFQRDLKLFFLNT